ncbi:MAG: asparagine synthase-related protein [Gammaproteobacteria bacterium]
MSGIAGVIRFDGAPVEVGLVEKMTAAMPYRGPDGIHHWVKGSVAMGQCMLHTTPESLEEKQPLTNEDESLILVMDGRVDNWLELRKELLGHGVMLRNRSDAELVLRSYELWGKNCLPNIDGDFALVIWDVRRQLAFCARDRVGNKPFYYHWDGKSFVFASELHTILSLPWVKQELNDGMLAEFLACEWYSREETFWLGIMRLVAAHRMEIRASGLKQQKYWSPDFSKTLPYKKDEEFVEHYRVIFADIVKRMSRSQATLSCEVSGGLDSSALFAMAEHLRRQHLLQAPSIDGYTLDFHNDPAANELEYARAVGKHWGKEIREILPSRLPISWYRQWTEHYRDLMPYPNGAMAINIRTAARLRGSRILMTGIGGDEWLWGDRGYYAELLSKGHWPELFNVLMRDCSDSGMRNSIKWLLQHGVAPLLPEIVKRPFRKLTQITQPKKEDRQAWLSPSMRVTLQQRRQQHRDLWRREEVRYGVRSQLMTLQDAFGTFSHESEERLAAREGVELRRPFWHPTLVQFAFSTPTQWRLRGNADRVLHRQSMAKLLPKVVLQRQTKADFMIIFQAPLAELREDLKGLNSMKHSAWVDSRRVEQLWNECNLAGTGGWPELRLWTLFACSCVAKNK